MKPDTATKSLAIFEGKFSRLKEERENVAKAKEALELAEPGKSIYRLTIYMRSNLCTDQKTTNFSCLTINDVNDVFNATRSGECE